MINNMPVEQFNTYVSMGLFAVIISLYVLLIHTGKTWGLMYAFLAPFATGLLVFIALDSHDSLKIFFYSLIVIGSLVTIASLVFVLYLHALSKSSWQH